MGWRPFTGHRFARARNRALRPLIAVALCAALPACNAVLGIDPPKEAPLDSEPEPPDGTSNGVEGNDDEPGEPSGPPIKGEPSPYAWAEWPMPNPAALSGAGNPQSFGTRAGDVVVDLVTKLEWQKSADEGLHTRKQAETYCENLKVAGGAFHLPSRIELLSLVDFTQSSLYLDADAFPDAASGKYWTSSRFAKDSAKGWLVNFEFGTSMTAVEGEHEEHLVRCVRQKGVE
jgi:hypothetical protein